MKQRLCVKNLFHNQFYIELNRKYSFSDIESYNIQDFNDIKASYLGHRNFKDFLIVLVGVVGGSVLIQKGNMQIKFALVH